MKYRLKHIQLQAQELVECIFSRETEAGEDFATLSFKNLWSHTWPLEVSGEPELLQGYMILDDDVERGEWRDWMDEHIRVAILSIPNATARELLYGAINAWAPAVLCPMEAHITESPVYALISVLYNSAVIGATEVNAIIAEMIAGIASLTVTTRPYTDEQPVAVEEEEDPANPGVIVEMELPEEVQKLMHNKEAAPGIESLGDGIELVEVAFGTSPHYGDYQLEDSPYQVAFAIATDWLPWQAALSALPEEEHGKVVSGITAVRVFEDFPDALAVFCFPGAESAFRHLYLPGRIPALTDEEIRERYPDYEDFSRKIDVSGAKIVLQIGEAMFLTKEAEED